jgi:hypothetical protein
MKNRKETLITIMIMSEQGLPSNLYYPMCIPVPLIYSMFKSFLETESPAQSYLIEEIQSKLRVLT